LSRAVIELHDGPNGQAVASASYQSYWVSSGNQPSREAALSKLAAMLIELWVDGVETVKAAE